MTRNAHVSTSTLPGLQRMLNGQQLADKLRECSKGHITLDAFDDWFAVESWNIHKQPNQELTDTVYEIEGIGSDHLFNGLSEAGVRTRFKVILAGLSP